jgi:histidinol-phosphate/aromatic aminotransferase/cobyric acid decarboxylase-like protein
MVAAIARARDVGRENILPGAGSSDLIFRALRHWLNRQSRVLLLDPTYGEYAHVLEDVIGCAVERFPLHSEDGFVVDVEQLGAALGRRPDLAILVNPNSPTGRHVSRAHLEAVLRQVPSTTRVWVDETYVDYVGGGESLERFAAESENVVVCKSMSKVYALSGARIAYLCAGAHQLEGLRAITPPWVVGLPSQLAAVRALEDREYYQMRYRETRLLRTALSAALSQLGWGVIPGVANFLLCRLPAGELWTAQLSARCQTRGLFLRDVTSMGSTIPSNYVRIAVKDEATNRRMLAIISEAMCSG